MGSTERRMRGHWLQFGALAAAAAVMALSAQAQERPPQTLQARERASQAPWGEGRQAPGQMSRLRAMDARAAALLQAGSARSATFRRLTDAIEGSDLIVWVSTGKLQPAGRVQFVAASPCFRYVRVAVRLPGLENALLSTLAHELQHVVEISQAPEVRSTRSLLRFYERIGWGGRSGAVAEMETAKAQEAGRRVNNELLEHPADVGR